MKKILVANRGEIAIRIMRSAKEMGIKTVAVYSDADRQSPHAMYADQAVHIGPSPSSESYLQMDKIIEVCKDLNVDAIHPGYGFLSENAEFARKVEKENIVFIGPSAHAMEMMGNKLKAKETVKKYNVPMVPGTDEKLTDINSGKTIAKEIGYPILIKAAAGGGGKGMRVVEQESQFEEQMNLAISEAISSFGDGSVFIERYVGSPRHIEIQILADQHGNVVHLFERECSVQRRHQKVVEEAPSSVLDDNLREEMGQCAISVAKSCNYVGAGTVEFLLDENNRFYFLEMNTRLQVEHPVTELITSVDLVKEQISLAAGNPLTVTQEQITNTGHTLEIRVNAEDPETFQPSPGKITKMHTPGGFGIRYDSHIYGGYLVPPYYDSLLAKIITQANSRESAIKRMISALDEFFIDGIKTNHSLHQKILHDDTFLNNKHTINYLENEFLKNVS